MDVYAEAAKLFVSQKYVYYPPLNDDSQAFLVRDGSPEHKKIEESITSGTVLSLDTLFEKEISQAMGDAEDAAVEEAIFDLSEDPDFARAMKRDGKYGEATVKKAELPEDGLPEEPDELVTEESAEELLERNILYLYH